VPDSEWIDRALAEALIREGTVDTAALRRAEAHRASSKGTLEDSLLALGLCGEREVLRALAKSWRLQYLMAEKVAQLRIPDALLEKIPVRLAEANWLLPFRLDEAEVLWILTPAPLNEEVVLLLLQATGAKALNRLLVRRATAWAGIRFHYYRDPTAFSRRATPPRLVEPEVPDPQDPFDRSDVHSVSRTLRCPSCDAPATLQDFQCSRCGLLLNPEASGPRQGLSEQSVVRAMLSAGPGAPPRRERGNEHPTVRTQSPLEGGMVPVLVAGLDVMERPLSEFEAYVASFVDGQMGIAELASATRLAEVEVQSILRSLVERKIIDLRPAIKPHLAQALAQARRAPNAPGEQDPEQQRTRSALEEALGLERAGRKEQAISVLKDAIATVKRPAPLYNRLALVLLDQRGDLRAAEELLKKACALEARNEVYQRNLYKVLGMAAVRALAIEEK